MPARQLLFLELNEINFEHVAYYCRRGLLPNLRRVIDDNGWCTTTSEVEYEHLEPWIQWVTAHTGLSLAEHGVFRLGDIVGRGIAQIWERLEEQGLKVGAISPMNAENRLRAPAFFVPDPWTQTRVVAPALLQRLYAAIAQAVNDNAQARLTASSLCNLLAGAARYARPANYAAYMRFAATVMQRPWRRAMFLDLLLADVFIGQVRRTQPHFASLFLNAGAHIQHHYMFSAACYDGPNRNPSWYAPPDVDPVREVYQLYDSIVGSVRSRFPAARVMLATGLHQVPHSQTTFYWRLKDHARFLRAIDVEFSRVEPRMSRDFIVVCADEAAAAHAAARLGAATAEDGEVLFEVDNRGRDLFVMLTYPRDIRPGFAFSIEGRRYTDLHEHVAFVALKNGEHSGIGYFLDCGAPKGSLPREFGLADVPQVVMRALGVPA